MPLPKQKFREIVFQLLYSHDLSLESSDETVPLLMEELSVSKANLRQAYERMQKIQAQLIELDQMIGEIAEAYEVERIGRVERNILRLAFFELFLEDQIPAKVAIAEGVRLARKFASPEAGNFVNGVLDRAYKQANPVEEEEDKQDIYFNHPDNDKSDPRFPKKRSP